MRATLPVLMTLCTLLLGTADGSAAGPGPRDEPGVVTVILASLGEGPVDVYYSFADSSDEPRFVYSIQPGERIAQASFPGTLWLFARNGAWQYSHLTMAAPLQEVRPDALAEVARAADEVSGGGTVAIDMINNTDAPVEVYYDLDASGEPTYYGQIAAGERHTQSSFARTTWLLAQAGRWLREYVATEQPSQSLSALEDTWATSPFGGDDVQLELVNNLGRAVDVYIDNQAGESQPLYSLQRGQRYRQAAARASLWRFWDGAQWTSIHRVGAGPKETVFANDPFSVELAAGEDLTGKPVPEGIVLTNQANGKSLRFTGRYALALGAAYDDPHRSRWIYTPVEDTPHFGYLSATLYGGLYVSATEHGKVELAQADRPESLGEGAQWERIERPDGSAQFKNRRASAGFLRVLAAANRQLIVGPGDERLSVWSQEKSAAIRQYEATLAKHGEDLAAYQARLARSQATSDVCWKESYPRDVGTIPQICPKGTEGHALGCYTPCRSGYTGFVTLCVPNCPAGYRDDGLYCFKPAAYTRNAYPWQFGDPVFNYDSAKKRCTRKHGANACEQIGLIWYQRCRAGFQTAPVAVNLCTPKCPADTTDIGVSCQKHTYDRGVTRLKECAAGEIRDAGLCYDRCKAGYDGIGPVCWAKQCPSAYPINCGASCGVSTEACVGSILNQTLSPLEVVSNIVVVGVTLGSATPAIAAANAAKAAARVGSKIAMKAALKEAAKKLGKELAEEALTNASLIVLDAAQDNEFDYTLLDPTGVAGVVDAFNKPLCVDFD